MPIDRSKLARDFVLVILSPDRKDFWGWEIRRKSQPLGVKLYGHSFKSESNARLAGNKALNELLDNICREENSSP